MLKLHKYPRLRLIAFRLKLALDLCPRLYVLILKIVRVSHWSKVWVVSKNTLFVLESFPRCSSSYSAKAISNANPSLQNRIATHTHMSAQVIEACRLGLPTLVLIRTPYDAILSYRALTLQVFEKDSISLQYELEFPISEYVDYYILYHKRIYPFHDKYVVADFSQTTSNLDKVVERVNQRFSIDLNVLESVEELNKKIFDERNFHLSPSARRDELKEMAKEELESPKNREKLKIASEIYNKLLLLATC